MNEEEVVENKFFKLLYLFTYNNNENHEGKILYDHNEINQIIDSKLKSIARIKIMDDVGFKFFFNVFYENNTITETGKKQELLINFIIETLKNGISSHVDLKINEIETTTKQIEDKVYVKELIRLFMSFLSKQYPLSNQSYNKLDVSKHHLKESLKVLSNIPIEKFTSSKYINIKNEKILEVIKFIKSIHDNYKDTNLYYEDFMKLEFFKIIINSDKIDDLCKKPESLDDLDLNKIPIIPVESKSNNKIIYVIIYCFIIAIIGGILNYNYKKNPKEKELDNVIFKI